MKFKEINNILGRKDLHNLETGTMIYVEDFLRDDFRVEFVGDDFNNDKWVVLMSFSDAINEMKSGKTIKRLSVGENEYKMSDSDNLENRVYFSFKQKDIFMNDWIAYE